MYEREDVLRVCEPYFDPIIAEITEAFDSQTEAITPAFRPILLAPRTANAPILNQLIVERLRLRFGESRTQPHWVQKAKQCHMLWIAGDGLNVALRPKKYDREFRCYQHRSEQQTDWRRRGRLEVSTLPGMETAAAHLMLGYRCTDELVPELLDIAVSYERVSVTGSYSPSWVHIIWRAGEGQLPAFPLPPDLFSPPGANEGQDGYTVKPARTDRPERRQDRQAEVG